MEEPMMDAPTDDPADVPLSPEDIFSLLEEIFNRLTPPEPQATPAANDDQPMAPPSEAPANEEPATDPQTLIDLIQQLIDLLIPAEPPAPDPEEEAPMDAPAEAPTDSEPEIDPQTILDLIQQIIDLLTPPEDSDDEPMDAPMDDEPMNDQPMAPPSQDSPSTQPPSNSPAQDAPPAQSSNDPPSAPPAVTEDDSAPSNDDKLPLQICRTLTIKNESGADLVGYAQFCVQIAADQWTWVTIDPANKVNSAKFELKQGESRAVKFRGKLLQGTLARVWATSTAKDKPTQYRYDNLLLVPEVYTKDSQGRPRHGYFAADVDNFTLILKPLNAK